MEKLYGGSKRRDEEVVALRQSARKIADASSHEREDIDHAPARVHQNTDGRVYFLLLLKNLNVLRLIVVIDAKILFIQAGDEVALIVFDGGEYVDEIDVDLEILRKRKRYEGAQDQGGSQQLLVHINRLLAFHDIDGKLRDL